MSVIDIQSALKRKSKKTETPLERLKRINAENQRPVTVTVGMIKAAINEITLQANAHGSTFATHITLQRLKAVIGEGDVTGGEL